MKIPVLFRVASQPALSRRSVVPTSSSFTPDEVLCLFYALRISPLCQKWYSRPWRGIRSTVKGNKAAAICLPVSPHTKFIGDVKGATGARKRRKRNGDKIGSSIEFWHLILSAVAYRRENINCFDVDMVEGLRERTWSKLERRSRGVNYLLEVTSTLKGLFSK